MSSEFDFASRLTTRYSGHEPVLFVSTNYGTMLEESIQKADLDQKLTIFCSKFAFDSAKDETSALSVKRKDYDVDHSRDCGHRGGSRFLKYISSAADTGSSQIVKSQAHTHDGPERRRSNPF